MVDVEEAWEEVVGGTIEVSQRAKRGSTRKTGPVMDGRPKLGKHDYHTFN
jgi:hypothetical protein